MQSAVVKRSIVISGHKTSVSVEDPFWICLKEIGRGERKTLSVLIASIDGGRAKNSNLSSAIRLFVLDYFRRQTSGIATGNGATPVESRQAPDRQRSQQVDGHARER